MEVTAKQDKPIKWTFIFKWQRSCMFHFWGGGDKSKSRIIKHGFYWLPNSIAKYQENLFVQWPGKKKVYRLFFDNNNECYVKEVIGVRANFGDIGEFIVAIDLHLGRVNFRLVDKLESIHMIQSRLLNEQVVDEHSSLSDQHSLHLIRKQAG